MAHNYIGWKRPEGHYPDRDGKWLLVIPIDGWSPATRGSRSGTAPRS